MAVSSNPVSTDFDFLNEMDFVPEDTEELEAMGGRGINAEEKSDESEEEETADEDDEFSDDDNFGDEEYKEDDY
ncbi:hypothetical protein D3C86_1841280 [compost metagenome]